MGGVELGEWIGPLSFITLVFAVIAWMYWLAFYAFRHDGYEKRH